MNEYLTYQDLADKIGVCKQTVYRWVKAGTVRAIRFSARVVVIPSSELDRLLAESAARPSLPSE